MSTTQPKISSSPVVTRVVDQLLAEMMSGELAPGQHISDTELAARFGVSRTPVREALQRLRDVGLVEASASRFTRVAEVSPDLTDQAYTVWKALYAVLLEETIPVVGEETVALMVRDRDEFVAALPTVDGQRLATANFQFVTRLHSVSTNAVLVRSLVSVVHIVRLGSLYLPSPLDLGSLGEAQELLIDAARRNDVGRAREAMDVLASIQVPRS
ncbi:DNA-binding GntR family transcriptional regulator [Microbacteriaceae bacterium SG_E_30_P1]|uniref:DNA-binding GntR family transcriptional regulator n=1 Tax=Antiquaquibacter oligotrophicus TaxID=2880260 RepID=A0ABT6KR75_9MICO|nr:GntR family transcriptional regulator [Antiquaquibacter oligotrophicus]MDH6182489.1 DNA-binding GntR family transcriptional regulator [Antiquaquibacter oligotrophicus]UDF14542.1 GntR family transcriptional regulator [Antiquaquibacter oligotrophicus]